MSENKYHGASGELLYMAEQLEGIEKSLPWESFGNRIFGLRAKGFSKIMREKEMEIVALRTELTAMKEENERLKDILAKGTGALQLQLAEAVGVIEKLCSLTENRAAAYECAEEFLNKNGGGG